MIESAKIVQTETLNAAVIHLQLPREQIQTVMEPAINELLAAVSGQGIGPTGPLFAHHLQQSSETFDFELGFPVNAAVTAVGRVKAGSLPGARVARTIYHGGYEGLYAAWEAFGKRMEVELGKQMEEEGLTAGATLWECYLKGPESDPDPATWRTELNLPLVKGK